MRLLFTLIISLALGWLVGRGLGEPLDSQSKQPATDPEVDSAHEIAAITSTDSLESFTSQSQRIPIDRLAHWLLDATPMEVAQLFHELSARPNQDKVALHLIVHAWARHDMSAVLAATKDTPFNIDAWQAVAIHHPDQACQQALAQTQATRLKEPLQSVLRSLGKHHPDWVQAHFESLQKDWMQNEILKNFRPDLENSSPGEAIDFFKRNGLRIRPDLLVALGMEDPVQALHLAEELQENSPYYRESYPQQLAKALAEKNPALLDALLLETKSPTTRYMIEVEKFRHEIKIDPEGAAASLSDLPKGYTKEDKLTALSRHYLESDPDKAIGIFSKLLAQSQSRLHRGINIISKNSNTTYGDQKSPPHELLVELVAALPEALIAANLPREGEPEGSYRAVAAEWVKQDPKAFGDWTSRQEDPKIYKESADMLTYALINQHKFPEAMQWAESVRSRNEGKANLIPSVYRNWYARDPEAAGSWRAATTLHPEEQNRLEQLEKEHQ